jgi:succinate dehydrogenase / fumarate reductase cytochrome b subunit
VASAASSSAPGANVVKHGVAPLRAGQGMSFVLRRLHSLSGIIPVGAFLFEHILISNSTAISGPEAYAKQVAFLGGLPLVFFLELFGISLHLVSRGWERDFVSVVGQLDVYGAALDRRHRVHLHHLAHVHDAIHGRRSAHVARILVR